MTTDETTVKAEAMTKKQLSALYRIDPRTFARWLKPFADRVGAPPNCSRIYTPHQVTIIFECLGDP